MIYQEEYIVLDLGLKFGATVYSVPIVSSVNARSFGLMKPDKISFLSG